MSKRLLVALMALSVVSAYACDDDKKEEKGGGQTGCVHAATRCAQNNTIMELCANGTWIKGKDCAANGNVCKVDASTNKADCEAPAPVLRCDADGVPESCLGEQCTKLEPCAEGSVCKSGECIPFGQLCTEGAKQCKNNVPEVCNASGDWVPGAACDVNTQVCSGGECVNKGDLCLEFGGECVIGKPCSSSEFQQVCIDDNAHAIVCNSNNVIDQYNCADNECVPSSDPKKVSCKKGNPEDIPATCVKNTDKGLCSKIDGKAYVCGDTGYYPSKCTGTCFECPDGYYVACGDSIEVACAGHMTNETCDETYVSKCSEDGTQGFYCSNGKVRTKNCTDPAWKCSNDDGYIDCNTCENPVATGGEVGGCCDTAAYVQSCGSDTDGSFLLQCVKNKITKKYCANNECSVNNDDPANVVVVCRNAGLPEDIPDTCKKGTDKGLCSSVDGKAYVCGDTGYYLNNKCTGTCFECPDNYWVACGESEEVACAGHMTPAETCDKAEYTPYCTEDGLKGYFCNNGKVKETSCPDANCDNDNGYISCGGRPTCDANSTAACKSACNADASEGYYWGSGRINVLTCENNDCVLDANGRVNCEGGTTPTENCTAASTAYCNKNCSADGSVGYYWGSGKVNTVECPDNDCTIDSQNHVVCGGGGENTLPNPHNDDRTAGASCDKTTYYGACSDDFTKRYYCDNNNQIVERTCDNGCDPASLGNNGSKCKTNTTPAENCTASSTAYCQKNCSADGSVGYYWGSGKVNTVECPDNDCIIDTQNHVVCSGGGGENTLPNPHNDDRTAGASCDKTSYYGACSDDFTKRYYCDNTNQVIVEKTCDNGCDPASLGNNGSKCKSGSTTPTENCTASSTAYCQKNCSADGSVGYYWASGKVNTVNCPDNDCIIDSANHVVCSGGGGENTLPNPHNDDRTAGASCDKTSYYGACSDDFTKRYYCDNTNQVVVEKDCANGCDPASLGNNGSKCKAGSTTPTEDCNASSTAKCKAVCTTDLSTGYYWNGTANAVVPVSCPNKDCNVSDTGYVACGACDVNTYETNCVGNVAKRCRNGQIVEKTCNAGTTCVVRTDGTCTVASSQCVEGHYNTTTYAHGYFECI